MDMSEHNHMVNKEGELALNKVNDALDQACPIDAINM